MAASSGDGLERRIAYVDGLRAIAVLAVVASHAAKWATSLHQGAAADAWSDGAHGVDLFFVLSGFCLSYPFLRTWRAKGNATFSIAGYFARRIVRIIPPYYLAMLLLGLGLAWAAHVGLSVSYGAGASPPSWLDIVKQGLFLDRQVTYINTSFWTLAIEWRWYFLFPLCLLLWSRSQRAFVALVSACAVAAAWTHANGWDMLALPAFLLGIIAADLELSQRLSGRMALLLFGLSLCLAIVLDPAYTLGYALQQPIGWQVASFFLVVAAGNVPVLRAALSLRPLVLIGVASYSIYLVHEPVINLLGSNTSIGPGFAACIGVACGVAFWLFFERWFVVQPWKGKLIGLLQSPALSLLSVTGIPRSFLIGEAPILAGSAPQGEAAARIPAQLVAGPR